MTQPKDTVNTENFKFVQNTDCEFFPCHEMKEQEELNCLFCYCPLAFLQCPAKEGTDYTILDYGGSIRKDCSNCTITHGNGGWEIVQKCLENPKPWTKFAKKVK